MNLEERKRELDYYGVLGISKGCSPQDIKNAYRRLSKQYNVHNLDNDIQKLFSLISEAYEVLSTPFLKAIYDQYGEEGLKQGVVTPYGWNPPYCYHGDPVRTYKAFYGTANPYSDLLDVLRNPPRLFDFPEGKGDKKKEPPIIKPLALTLEELYHGCQKLAKIQRRVFADEECVITEVKEQVLTILIKPGTPPCTQIVFTEAGDQGHAVIPGDVIFVVEDKPHPVYRREGMDLHMTTHLTLAQSLTGTIITIKTLDERILRTAITQVVMPGYQKIIENEGMPSVDNPDIKGNLIISFEIEHPKFLPLASKKLILRALNEMTQNGGTSDSINELVNKDKADRTVKQDEVTEK